MSTILEPPLTEQEQVTYRRFAQNKSHAFALGFIEGLRNEDRETERLGPTTKRRLREELAEVRCRSLWKDILEWLLEYKKPTFTLGKIQSNWPESEHKKIIRHLKKLSDWGAIEKDMDGPTGPKTIYSFPKGDPLPPTPREELERILLRIRGRNNDRSKIVKWVLAQPPNWSHAQLSKSLPNIEIRIIDAYLAKWEKAGLLARRGNLYRVAGYAEEGR